MFDKCPPTPSWNESDRLRAIDSYDILDTPREEEFEDIAKMAAAVCEAPISVITFVAKDRQWFKAEIGLGVTETPLDVSICAHAILQEELFIVPDTTKDPRFANNPLVIGDPKLRFYAGALLATTDGLPLGTMCVLDYVPRALTEQQLFTLKALARQVMTQLDLRRTAAQLQRTLEAKNKNQERLDLALDSSSFIGIWEWDIVQDRVFADSRFVAAFGGEPEWSTEGAPIAEYIKAIHPDDLPRVKAGIESATKDGTLFAEEYRLRLKDGAERWIEARGRCHYDADGKPMRFPGVGIDITPRKLEEQKAREAAERFQFMAEAMPQKLWTAKATGEIDFFNHLWVEYTGLAFEEIRDWGWKQFIHPDDLDETVNRYAQAVAEGKAFELEQRLRRHDGAYRWHLARAAPMRDASGKVIMWMGSNTDIDDQRRASQTLGEVAAKFRAIFDQSSVFAGIMTTDGVVIEANSLSLGSCGYRAEEVLGRPFWECGWWQVSEEVKEKIRLATRLAAAGTPYMELLPYVVADGSTRMVDFALHPIRNDAGEVIFLHPTGVDVTVRQRAAAQAEFLSQLTHQLSAISDPVEINAVATRAIGEFMGVDRCHFFQLLDKPGHVQVMPDWRRHDRPSIDGEYALANFGRPEWIAALSRGPVGVDDIKNDPRTEGFVEAYTALHVAANAFVPFSHEGRWVACIGVNCEAPHHWTAEEMALLENAIARVWPLIERARVEGALRESEKRFRAMSDNIAPLAWMAGPDGLIFWYNKRWYDYTGETFASMEDGGRVRVHSPEHRPHVLASWGDAVQKGHRWEETFPLRGADGQFRWFLSQAYPVRGDDEQIALWFGVHTDITELRDVQHALRAANDLLGDKAAHLEAIVQQRTQKLSETIGELEAFSYSISHDMRSPLRSMMGFAHALREDYGDRLDGEGIEYLDRIANASRRMDRLIQDVLTFSRVSRQEVVLEEVPTGDLIRGIIDSYPNLHPSVMDISIADDLATVKGNEALLTQCFSNLLENASKFTAKGKKPRVKIWSECSPGRARIFFQDHGIGIAEHHLTRIFDIFQRVGRDDNGTGIGLSIVRKAVEKMGGAIHVQSELGSGSLFWLELASA